MDRNTKARNKLNELVRLTHELLNEQADGLTIWQASQVAEIAFTVSRKLANIDGRVRVSKQEMLEGSNPRD